MNCEPLYNLSRGVIDVPVKIELLTLKTVTSYLENCAILRRNYVFRVINPLFLTHLGVRMNCEHLHNLSRGVIDVPVKFELLILKTVRLHVEITFFE